MKTLLTLIVVALFAIPTLFAEESGPTDMPEETPAMTPPAAGGHEMNKPLKQMKKHKRIKREAQKNAKKAAKKVAKKKGQGFKKKAHKKKAT